MPIAPLSLFSSLQRNDIDFYTGVPDSLLKDFCAYVGDHAPEGKHIIAANEGNAIALAAGYNLKTGKIPLVYMQNSGLGNAVNPIMSLCDRDIYAIPMILLIGWRGEPGTKDAIQHVKDGRVQEKMLKAMELSYQVISGNEHSIDDVVTNAIETVRKEKQPFVLLVQKGALSGYEPKENNVRDDLCTREEAIDVVLDELSDDTVLVSTTGKTSREVYELRTNKDQAHHNDFLTVGSMGHCSSIAMGAALARKETPVVCLDGDGAVIMHMGAMAIIGSQAPKNFKHIVINNGAHESVGGQPTAAFSIDLCAVAKGCGYKHAHQVTEKKNIKAAVKDLVENDGPALLEIHVRVGSRSDLGRPKTNPEEDKLAFMRQ